MFDIDYSVRSLHTCTRFAACKTEIWAKYLQFLPLGGSSADGTKTEKLELMEKLMEKLELMSLRENKFRITSQSKRVLSSFSSFRT